MLSANYKRLCHYIRDDDVIVLNKKNDWSNSKTGSRIITIGTIGPNYILIAALAHEYGHVLRFRDPKSKKGQLFLYTTFKVVRNKRHQKAILEEERIAWVLGFAVLRKLNIPVTNDMKWFRREMLASHKRATDYLLSK